MSDNEFRRPCPNCGNPDGGWDQPRWGWRCPACWDIGRCPDGAEHVWVPLATVLLAGEVLLANECARCSVGSLEGVATP